MHKEITIKQLNCLEFEVISGGCAEHCWGDFSLEGFLASAAAGALGGAAGGWAGAALGAMSGGLGYAAGKIGDKLSERTTSTSDE